MSSQVAKYLVIITAEISAKQNHRKFITVLARGTWAESLPSAFRGKKSIDLSDGYKRRKNYPQLLGTILGTHPQPPPLGRPQPGSKPPLMQPPSGSKPPVHSRLINQMRSAPHPVSLELYDRRLPVYKAAQRLIDYIITKGACTEEELGKFGAAILDARHLFNEDIESYLRTLYREATAVWLGKEKQERMAGQHPNEEYRNSLNALCDRVVWFSKQFAVQKKMIRAAYTSLWEFRTRARIALTNDIRQCGLPWRSKDGHPKGANSGGHGRKKGFPPRQMKASAHQPASQAIGVADQVSVG